ncbi:MAG: endo-1,4-beta-xylanase [Oscillospiraceae bacterium]|nr:endo-1,4-beta-xylanase [Oscillospiraceae bacterium]
MNNYEHRKARANIVIRKGDAPAAGIKVKAKLIRHEFLFGCGGFDILAYANAGDEAVVNKLKGRVELWSRLFNYATLPFYWGRYEPEEGKPEKAPMDKAVAYLNSIDAKVKGHPLCWHTVCADWLLKYSDDEIMKRQEARITRELNDFKGKVTLWDAINETVIMPVFDKYDNAVTRICNRYGRIPLIKKIFDTAKQADPDAVLLINDFNTSMDYAHVIEQCLDAGVPISAIGIQSHQHQGYWGAEKLETVLSRFEAFGLPIHFTENSIISGELMPPEIEDLNDYHNDNWQTTPEFEERQRTQMEEMYRILFSHPLVKAISQWDFADGMWLDAPSGIIRRDGSPKPAYEMLYDLIHKEWSTDITAETDENGIIVLDGFKGDYEITVNGSTFTVTLTDSSDDIILNLA